MMNIWWARTRASLPMAVTSIVAGIAVICAGLSMVAAYAVTPPVHAPSGVHDRLSGMSDADIKRDANVEFWADDYIPARSDIECLINRSHCSLNQLNHECLERFMDLAVCLMQENETERARSILSRLRTFAEKEGTDDNNSGMDEPDTEFFMAECDYKTGHYKRAENLYQEALKTYRKLLAPLSNDLAPCLDGLAGCYCRRGDYADALPLFQELVKIDVLNRGPDDLATGWSLQKLTNVLEELNRFREAAPLFEKAIYIFRQKNFDRILAKYKRKKPDATAAEMESVKSKVRRLVFGDGDRSEYSSGGSAFRDLIKDIDFSKRPEQRPYDFYNWRLKRTRVTDAPGLVTINPDLPLKALIICVHGLGLHHGTFQPFADQMAKRGFGVIAFDVRGFGSYREHKGYDRVDLDRSVEDIVAILKVVRRDYPDTSIFLLGESMGGALALQVAAADEKYIDGLVCSVPSGNRFGATTTGVNVAMRFLKQRNKPFDIGSRIVKQATVQDSLREHWQTDPEARLELSPLELIQFQRFMNQNLKAARQLDKVPVIVFQGYGDKLVKPEGTVALYNALETEDKDLVFIGHAEHLIFEEGQFKPAAINGLSGWLEGHLKSAAAAASQ